MAYPRYRDKEHMDKRQAEPADMVDSAAIAAVGICFAILQSIVIYVKITDTKPGA